MNNIKRIAKNVGYLFVSQTISSLIGFFYFMYTARYLGVNDFGILSFALALTGIFGVFINLGLDQLTVREVARDRSMTGKYIDNIFVIKIILAIFTFGSMKLMINLLNFPEQKISVLYLIALSVIFTSFSNIFYSIFQAHEKMEYSSIGAIINSTLMLVLAFFAIYRQLGVLYFASIYVTVSIIVFVYIFTIYSWKFDIPKLSFDWEFWKVTIKKSLPFATSMIFITVYYWIDSVMLSIMKGEDVVGIYNAAYKLIVILLFIPSIFNVTLYPAMSRFYVSSKDSLLFAYERYFKYMAVIGFPIGVGTTLLANRIIQLIFGTEYIGSSIALQILIWSSVCIFLGSSFGRLLESSDKQIIVTVITGLCAIENVLLNLIVIPRFSYVGASVVTLITEFTALCMCIIASSRLLHLDPKNNLLNIVKPVLASLCMGILILYLNYLNLILLILLSIPFYFTVLYLMRGFETTDYNLVTSIFHINQEIENEY